MVRTDKNGDTLWTKVLSGAGEVFLTGIEIDLAGDSIVVCGGSANGGAGGTDGYVAKFDTLGNIGWEQYFGTVYDDYLNDISHLDTYYACGGGRGTSEPDNEDMWFMKLDYQTGNMIWEQDNSVGSTDQDIVNSVCLTENGTGDIFYAGQTKSYGFSLTDGEAQFFYEKRDAAAGYLANNEYGKLGHDAAHSIQGTYDGGAVIIGDIVAYSTGGGNILIVKIQVSWNKPDSDLDLVYQNITSGVDELISGPELLLYPNPTNDALHIKCEKEISQIQLYSTQGTVLMMINEPLDRIDLRELEQGTYILRLKVQDEFHNRIIVKQ